MGWKNYMQILELQEVEINAILDDDLEKILVSFTIGTDRTNAYCSDL